MIEPLRPPRLRGNEALSQMVTLLSDGNPGAIRIFMEVIFANREIGLAMLLAADKTGFTGPRIWALCNDFAQTPMRAAALLIMCAELEVPTPQELLRDVENAYRDQRGPSPLLETALDNMPTFAPLFAGIDLKKPEVVT